MNQSDRRILTIAVGVLLLALSALFLTGRQTGQAEADAADSGAARYVRPSVPSLDAPTATSYELFPFDPNTADSTQLLRLGLRRWQVRNLYRYRARGGIFRRKEDFARLYGLTVGEYRRLAPYIRIGADYQPASVLLTDSARRPRERDTADWPVKIKEGERIVLNLADTSQLKRVPGIGSYFAREIVRHGQWLGGYVSVDQLDEIDHFPAEAKQYFVVSHPQPRKLNINRLSLQELRRHPYINFYQARAIIDYRRLRGPIHSLQELRLSRDFPEEAIRRLEPYVEY